MLRFDIEIFRIDATHVICTSFLSSHYIILSAPLHNHRRKIAHSFHTLADRLQVAVAHLPVTPFLIPFVGFAGPEKKNAEFVEKPSTFFNTPFLKPLPEPNRITSIRMPQNTPKPVSRLRVLLRVIVTHISTQRSISNMNIIFLFSITNYSLRSASIAVILTALRAGK